MICTPYPPLPPLPPPLQLLITMIFTPYQPLPPLALPPPPPLYFQPLPLPATEVEEQTVEVRLEASLPLGPPPFLPFLCAVS